MDEEFGIRVLMYQPATMRARCIGTTDLARLRKHHHVITPEVEDDAELKREWSRCAGQFDAVVTGWGTPPITDAMLDAAQGLQLIVHAAGSVKYLLPLSVWDRGICVASCNEALAINVAETTLGMIILGLKGVFQANALTHQNGWKINDTDCPGFRTREVYETTIGLIGASQVGRHVIRLLRAFEAHVLVADPYLGTDEAELLEVERVSLDELLCRSDVVSLHAPALPETRQMLGREQFRMMKDGAIFINTARGMIVDENALAEELVRGRLFAFIDVTDPEPPAKDHPFRQVPNVVLTPHIAGATSNGCRRLGRSAVDQLLLFTRGQRPSGEITAQRLATMA